MNDLIEGLKKLKSEKYRFSNLYASFGFVRTNKIKLEITDDAIYYENNSGWILSHELKKHDSFKYSYRLELFKRDMSSYFDLRDYIWLTYNITEEVLKIEKKVLILFQENLVSDFRDYQLKQIFR